MKSLKLSKVVRATVPIMARRPAFGASGLTYSKCLKSAGYLSSPKADSPCLPLSAAALAAARTRQARSSAGFHMRMSPAFAYCRIIRSRGEGASAPRIGEPLGGRLIIPPHSQERAASRRQCVGAAKHVPHRQTIERRGGLRHDVV